MPRVIFNAVTFNYRRGRPALADVSLDLEEGIVGLIGPNGAGKTSLLKLLMGVVQPAHGSITIDGMAPDAYRSGPGIGYFPEHSNLPAHLTVDEFLTGVRRLALPHRPATPDVRESFAADGLNGARLGELSLGQRRRVELAAALIGDPAVLLLDEPTNGLDPRAVAALRTAILEQRCGDRLIVVSSHHLDELQRIVDRVVMIDHGRVAGVWTAAEIAGGAGSVHDLFHSVVAGDER